MSENLNARQDSGPRPIAGIIPRLTRPIFRKRSPAGVSIFTDWLSLVGPEIAAVALPHKYTGQTLTIACGSAQAVELSYMKRVLMERINTNLGRKAVEDLRFVHAGPPRTSRAVSPASEENNLPASVEMSINRYPEGPLRDTLLRLGKTIYQRRPADRR